MKIVLVCLIVLSIYNTTIIILRMNQTTLSKPDAKIISTAHPTSFKNISIQRKTLHSISTTQPATILLGIHNFPSESEVKRIATSRNVSTDIVKNVIESVKMSQNETIKAYHCININVPSESSGILIDANLYKQSFPNSVTKFAIRGDKLSQKKSPTRINLYLEIPPQKVIYTRYYPNSEYDRNDSIWLMVNHEWIFEHYLEGIRIGVLVAKTKIAVDVLRKYREKKNHTFGILYTGHSSRDALKSTNFTQQKWNEFLHIGGGSGMKNTLSVFRAWLQNPSWPKITIRHRVEWMCKMYLQEKGNLTASNIDMKCGSMSLDEVIHLQNTIKLHLCPSKVEGFGHYINEAMSTGAVVLTSNVAPMNELVDNNSGILIGTEDKVAKGAFKIPTAVVEANHIAIGVNTILKLSLKKRMLLGHNGRIKYQERQIAFFRRMKSINDAFCGNFMDFRHVESMLY